MSQEPNAAFDDPELSIKLQEWMSSTCKKTSDIKEIMSESDTFLRSYDIRRTAASIRKSKSKRVALQFPDSLLPDAPLVCFALRHLLHGDNVLVFILGDTSYGECCVDEVAAQHLDADLVIHYGPACLSPTRTLPVMYVFPGQKDEEKSYFSSCLSAALRFLKQENSELDGMVILYEVDFYPMIKECTLEDLDGMKTVFASLRIDTDGVVPPVQDGSASCANHGIEVSSPDTEYRNIGALQYQVPVDQERKFSFLWVGHKTMHDESSWTPALRNAALHLSTGLNASRTHFYSCAISSSGSPQQISAHRLFKRRFREIRDIKYAERIAIVAGTLGISGNLEIIERCKRIIRDAGKRSYVVLVGKPSPEKFLNFAEMDAYVLVACPENSLLSSRDYFKPVLTPIELESALGSRDFLETPYTTDFRDLFDKPPKGIEPVSSEEDAACTENYMSVISRKEWGVQVSGTNSAAEFFATREWKGLEKGHGGRSNDVPVSDLPVAVEEGSTGMALRYERENR